MHTLQRNLIYFLNIFLNNSTYIGAPQKNFLQLRAPHTEKFEKLWPGPHYIAMGLGIYTECV